LLGIVVDWLDAEIKGLGNAVGKELAITLLKGNCKVHWTRSWQRVRDRVATTKDKVCENIILKRLHTAIPECMGLMATGN
jgi:5,10-methylene-tetrahydrofolate dehydrogenase/methenyl tetrahydrofolate cyclohydrolase